MKQAEFSHIVTIMDSKNNNKFNLHDEIPKDYLKLHFIQQIFIKNKVKLANLPIDSISYNAFISEARKCKDNIIKSSIAFGFDGKESYFSVYLKKFDDLIMMAEKKVVDYENHRLIYQKMIDLNTIVETSDAILHKYKEIFKQCEHESECKVERGNAECEWQNFMEAIKLNYKKYEPTLTSNILEIFQTFDIKTEEFHGELNTYFLESVSCATKVDFDQHQILIEPSFELILNLTKNSVNIESEPIANHSEKSEFKPLLIKIIDSSEELNALIESDDVITATHENKK